MVAARTEEGQACSNDSLFAAQPTHAATEAHLAAQGMPFTALRNGFYARTLGYFIGGAVESGQPVLLEDGPVSLSTSRSQSADYLYDGNGRKLDLQCHWVAPVCVLRRLRRQAEPADKNQALA